MTDINPTHIIAFILGGLMMFLLDIFLGARALKRKFNI